MFLPTAYQEASDYITFFFFCAIAASIWPLCSNKWHAWICGLNCTPEAQVIIYNLFNVYSPRLIKISDKSIRTIPQSTWGLFSFELTACNRVTSNRILSKELLIWCFSFCQKTSWFRFSFDNLLHSFPYNRSADLLNTICISCFSSSTFLPFSVYVFRCICARINTYFYVNFPWKWQILNLWLFGIVLWLISGRLPYKQVRH